MGRSSNSLALDTISRRPFSLVLAVREEAKSSMVVLHPLPRNEEVAEEVDFDQRAAYFRQVSWGEDGESP